MRFVPASVSARGKAWIGHDPNVGAAASSTTAVRSVTEGLGDKATHYVSSLFPFTKWILHYNLTWLLGDLIAGITVGLVAVPQSMSYAQIATLPPQYGLYSSFVGVAIYAVFATSKDVSIGPVAVMSLEVSKVIHHVQEQSDLYTGPQIAVCLAFICGFIVLGIGLLRLGWIVEFIPGPAVSGFMTGSALSIIAGQVPGLMGYKSLVNTRASTYQVIINTLKHLPDTQRDAAFGLSGLFFLYAVRSICRHIEAKSKRPLVKRIAFFASTLRSAFVIIFLTVFAWVYLRGIEVESSKDYPIAILGTVPAGFQEMGPPVVDATLIGLIGPLIPVSTIILLLEHIAIAKSFGRINNYTPNANQELIAMGVTNTLGTLFAAYPATGSFSRTAIKSKAGVRTPLAGWFTAICVIIALYGLTDAFYWIPNAALSAVIIHAVGDLIASPPQVYSFWKVNPIEAIIWFGAVLATIFATIEIGIYVAVAASAVLLLFRIARPTGYFLGRVRVVPDSYNDAGIGSMGRDVYIPLTSDGVTNPWVKVEPAPPGVIIYKMNESFLFPNASYYSDVILEYAKANTRRGVPMSLLSQGARPWNDPGPSRWGRKKDDDSTDASSDDKGSVEGEKPILRAVVLDFSSVSNIDTTSVQNLVDLRRALERYADREVEFHFATILSPWIKRALVAGGFGTGAPVQARPLEIAPVVASGTQRVPVRESFLRKQYPPSVVSVVSSRGRTSAPGTPPNGRRTSLTTSAAGMGTSRERSLSQATMPEVLAGHEPTIAEEASEDVTSTRAYSGEIPTVVEPEQQQQQQPPQDEEAGNHGPLVSPMFSRFHLDLPSAVAAAVGYDW